MLRAALATLACLCAARATPTDNYAAYYPLKHTYTSTKNLQTILQSIDDRLRILDAISLEQTHQARRLDAIQHKMELLEATVSVRLEQAELATNRLEHRLHMMQTNMQDAMESTSARLERSQARVAAVALNLTRNLEPHRHLLDKLSGAYGETWRRGMVLEGLTRDGLALVNVTRRELADGLRTLARRQREYRLSTQDLDAAVNEAGASFAKKLNDQTHKLDKKIQTVLTAQEHFLDTCHRIQKDEPHHDTHVADLLEKLVDTVINKTANTFHKLQAIQTEVKNHDSKVARALSGRALQPSELILRKIEAIVRNASSSTARELELQKLTDKYIDLTNRADAALLRFESRFNEAEEPADTSNVTSDADELIDKLKSISRNDDYDDYDDPESDSFLDDGGGNSEDSKEMISEAEGKGFTTARPPHRRHLHKHPYDRGPNKP